MVVLNKIYTRAGDGGQTALGDGARVAKTALRVDAYGSVDETNAAIGMAVVHAEGTELLAGLARIQNDLFDVGADLCVPPTTESESNDSPSLRATIAQVERLEAEIDAMTARLEPLRTFVLPGGSPLAAALHVARTVGRRAERAAFRLAETETVGADALQYLNRLSDWLFVAARIANDEGRADRLWQPGANTT